MCGGRQPLGSFQLKTGCYRAVVLGAWPQVSSTSIIWEPVRNSDSWAYPRPVKLEVQEGGAQHSVF